MVWAIEFDEAAKKELAKLDRQVARRLLDFLKQRVISLKDPRSVGQALKGSKLGEFWKYRVRDFRIIASIQDQKNDHLDFASREQGRDLSLISLLTYKGMDGREVL